MGYYGRESNVILGTIGAIVGSLVGVAIWIVIYRLGFIAAIAGVAIIASATKGYEILGGELDKKGVIISAVVALIMVFFANYISWCMSLYFDLKSEYQISFIDIVKILPGIIKEAGVLGDFIKDLVIGYILTIIGGFSTIRNNFSAAN
ncbi:MAG: hypothetical protein E7254_07925 [Lachnospiraceae bacterium]|nr:hypothetical protein [Lachnospiraceae bacterium]